MSELGYNSTAEQMAARIENIRHHIDFKTFIATYENEVVGMVGLTKNFSYENDGIYVRVLALVTHSKFRRKRIGNTLMETAENWAKEIGATKVLLNCGTRQERTVAHKFYEKIGYQIKSLGFVKNI